MYDSCQFPGAPPKGHILYINQNQIILRRAIRRGRGLMPSVKWQTALLLLLLLLSRFQSCPTLCDPMDRSPPGSPVPGILQARTLEWVAISFSNA